MSVKEKNEGSLIPKSAEEIYSDLAESRACYERGEFKDFDEALNEISEEYGI